MARLTCGDPRGGERICPEPDARTPANGTISVRLNLTPAAGLAVYLGRVMDGAGVITVLDYPGRLEL